MKISNITENHCHFYSLRQEIQIWRRLILTLTEDDNFHCLIMGYKSPSQSCTSHGWKWFNLQLTYLFPVKFSSYYLWPDKNSSAVYNLLVGQDSHTTSVHNYLSTFMPDIFHYGTMKISLFMSNACHLKHFLTIAMRNSLSNVKFEVMLIILSVADASTSIAWYLKILS